MLMTLTSFPQLFFYIGFMLNFFTGLSVSSLFVFRRRPGWRKLRVVSFAWPLVPAIFLLVGAWLILYGLMLKPSVSMIGVITLAVGALIYHVRIAPQLRKAQARRPLT